MKKLYSLLALLCIAILSGCGGGSQPPVLTVTVVAANATVQAGGTVQVTATVANDAMTKGVSWTITCATAPCGSVSPTSTASGTATTYTAPATPPAADLTVTVTATSVSDGTKAGTATIKVLAVTVSVAPATVTVQAGTTQQFTATVSNTSNASVTWMLTCSAAQCGTLSSATANPVTYTAPGPPASNLTVTITAKSVADSTKTNSATITVPAITVAVAPSSANVPVKGTQSFTATVSNDAANKGVTWTLSRGGAACSPVCGTITAATASGSPATYTAPTTVPASPTVTVTATSVSDLTKATTATATVVGITVSVLPTSASVVVSATKQFTPTVTNDISNSGVTWTLTQGGVACAVTCGTVAPTTTASGTATTYTAPATVPSTPTVTLTATSVADPTKFVSATITITAAPPISVSISPTNQTVTINGTQQFTPTVTNDTAANGVTWTLTQSGVACSPVCGAVSPASTASGTATTYTAPAAVPTPATVTITATSVTDNTKSTSTTITVSANPPCGSGSEAKLNGQYAFLLQGFDSNGPVAISGSFTANGAATNNITAGQEDINRNIVAGVTNPTITTAGSSYSIGSDNRGCLTLVTGTTTSTYRFSLGSITSGVATKGHMVSFDASGTNAVGVFEKQTASAFSPSSFNGNFAFGASAPKAGGGRFGLAGTITLDGASAVTAAEVDTDDSGGAPRHVASFTGTYTVASNGRGTFTLNPPGTTVHISFYVVSANEALLMSIDPQVGASANSLFAGSALKQSGGPFGISSLNGTTILSQQSLTSTTGQSDVQVGFLTPAGNGSFTLSTDHNKGGIISTLSASGTYSVAANGRVTVTVGGTTQELIYLVTTNEGFFVGTDNLVDGGFFEPQVGTSFNNSSFSGAYFFGNEGPVVSTSSLQSGVATSDGAGNINVTSDNNQAGTLLGGQTNTNTYSVSSNGRTTLGNNVLYIVSPSKAYLMSIKAGKVDSTLTVVEK